VAEPEKTVSEFERGKEAGRVAAILADHTTHLAKINGSIADSAVALSELASEVRSLREEATLRQVRIDGSLSTLAAETERRAKTLAQTVKTGEARFSRRGRFTAWGLALAVLLALVAVMFMALSLAQ